MTHPRPRKTADVFLPQPSGPDASPQGGSAPTNLRDLFFHQCRLYHAVAAYVILADDLSILSELSFGELERRVASLASALSDRLPPRERVVLALSNGLDSIELFWACVVAGLVPIPAPAPDPTQSRETGLKRLHGITSDSSAALVVTADDRLEEFSGLLPTAWTSRAALEAGNKPRLPDRSIAESDVAYLQYTSGSTSEPRGVELTHANILMHYAALHRAIDTGVPNARTLNWLPWFHDFGLLQGVISPVYAGTTTYHLPTSSFVRRPLRWLEAIARFEVTYSGAPDTAFLACTRALARKPNWTADLSTWSVAICGAEPVRADTLQAFAQAFAPHGFRPQSLFPAYGLAECVLGVSIKCRDTLPQVLRVDAAALELNIVREAAEEIDTPVRSLVSCGEPLDVFDVRIVDPNRKEELPPGTVGEIWTRGPSVSPGYWGQRALTDETFGATLASGPAGERYLRTGDLGFEHDHQIIVTGRIKDLIIVHGRNIYPQDIELTAKSAHHAAATSGVIAFGIEKPGGEAIVLLAECSGALEADEIKNLVDSIRLSVSAEHQVEIHDIVPLRRGSLPKTSSGKLRRAVARKSYIDGEFELARLSSGQAASPRQPRDATERAVSEIWMDVLGLDDCDVETNFFSKGGNSLLATQLVSRLNIAFGANVPISTIFDRPTIEGLATELRAQTRLAGWSQTSQPVRVKERSADQQLSFSQERIWFLHQQAPESTAYHMPLAIRFRGPLNAAALEAALARVVDRHEILRTTFESNPSGVVGRVHAVMPLKLRRSQLVQASSQSSQAELEQRLARLTQEPFDFERGPLIRADLIELAPQEAVLLIVKQHIIGDQWSFAVLAREIAHFYRMNLGIESATLPALPIQYSDYAVWQRAAFEANRRLQEEAYWRSQLLDLEPLTVPLDRPRRPRQPLYRGSRIRVPLDPALIEALTSLGAKHSASLAMVLIAALKVLLHRRTGQRDIAIGVPIANRHHAVTESLIGSFVNVLVLRNPVKHDDDFPTLLERVRRTSLEAFAHQDMPFELLVRTLRRDRELGGEPVFQVLFNMINAPVGKLDFGDLTTSRIDFDRGATQYDLTVTVDAQHDLSIVFEYAVELFQPQTIEQIAAQYLLIIQEVARAQDIPIAHPPLTSETERAKCLEWGRGVDLVLGAGTVPDWLRPSLETHADRPAVVFGDRSATFGDLDRASTALADCLRRRGIGRGHKVGLYVERSIEMLVAQLGTLKCGAAYVPLDPVNPAARLDYMARDAALQLIVVHPAHNIPEGWAQDIPTLAVTATTVDDARDVYDAPATGEYGAKPDDAAYVIYTSGSTGLPKGVTISHRAVVNLLTSIASEPGVDASDRMLALTTLSFDISVAETLLPLGTGALIVLATHDEARDVAALRRLIEDHRVTIIQATPSTWHLLLNAGWKRSPSLKKAFATGEPLREDLAADLFARCGELWNLYGPTETTVWSTAARVEHPDRQRVSIGRPIANTQAYVLDIRSQLCPVGVEGELCIGGLGVSQGYLNQPQLTAQCFVPNPFSHDPVAPHLYRTGDRARWRHDGTLELLGRSDSQVKLRGHRVELSEIEAALARLPNVDRAVAVVREVGAADKRLVAYVTSRSAPVDSAWVRNELRRHLPEYMLPQHVVAIDALPLLPSGKLDFNSLPPVGLDLAAGHPPTAPRNATERAMWAAWRDLLGVTNFGVFDNFFDLGGHSMLAIRLVDRIRQEIDSSCTLPLLFQYPTIAGLCEAMVPLNQPQTLVALQDRGEGPPLFCICGIHLYQSLADCLAPHKAVHALFVPCELDLLNGDNPPANFISVEKLADDYLQALVESQPHGPYYLAGLSFGGLLAFEIAHQLRRKGEEVAFLAMFDTAVPEGRRRAAARRAVRHAHIIRDAGFDHIAALGRLRLARTLRMLRAEKADVALAMANAQDARRIALRDAIYFRAMSRYTPRRYDGNTMLIRAESSIIPDSTEGWSNLIPNLEIVRVPGDHLEILKSPNVGNVAKQILSSLERATCTT